MYRFINIYDAHVTWNIYEIRHTINKNKNKNYIYANTPFNVNIRQFSNTIWNIIHC